MHICMVTVLVQMIFLFFFSLSSKLRMEDSRKGKKDDEKGLSTSSPHVDEEKGKEAIVYKTKKGKRKGTGKLF